jgi:hypothetical protein
MRLSLWSTQHWVKHMTGVRSPCALERSLTSSLPECSRLSPTIVLPGGIISTGHLIPDLGACRHYGFHSLGFYLGLSRPCTQQNLRKYAGLSLSPPHLCNHKYLLSTYYSAQDPSPCLSLLLLCPPPSTVA